MKKLMVLLVWGMVAFAISLQGCQARQDDAAAREKEKNFWKDGTPENYKKRQGKPEKPYWEN